MRIKRGQELLDRQGFLTLDPTTRSLADLYHTGGPRPKQNSPDRCLLFAPHVLRAHRKLQQNKQLTTGIPLSAARRLPAGKISRKPRGPGAGGRPRRARHSAPGGRPAGGSTRGPLSRCRFRSELWGSACTLPASGASLSPRRRGRGDRSLSPTSSKLFSSHSTPAPFSATAGDNLRGAGPHSTALPYCPSGDPTAGSVGRLYSCFQVLFSPFPRRSYTRACTKAPFTPPAPPSAPPWRPAAVPLPTRRITVLVQTLPVVTRTRAVFALRAATRATDTLPSMSASLFIAVHWCPPPAPPKHVPPTIL